MLNYQDCVVHKRVALFSKVLPLQTGTITDMAAAHPTAGPQVEVTWDKGTVQKVTVRSLIGEEEWEAHEAILHAKSQATTQATHMGLPINVADNLSTKENKLERRIVDTLRSAMYGTDPLWEEVEELGKLLEQLDGVVVDPTTNRLSMVLSEMKKKPSLWKKIDHLNDDK